MLEKNNTGLIIIDVQGKLAHSVHENEALIANCTTLVKGALALDLPIVWAEQIPQKLGATVPQINSLLPDHQPIDKFTFSACDEPRFLDAIKSAGVDSFLICGIEAHICVYQTAAMLKGMGFNVEVVTDCVSSRTPENKALAINKLNRLGVQSTGLEMCFYELVKDSRSNSFKPILNLIK
ncbi:hydrolase [Vibrio sp. ZSDE26]|uniref:Hydrolase n=1 Tax=Vibrio amylolyticus TaxID=2847292 RepID=A0A9X1XEU2_9VIBR|nr:hydrolase [Vibrio amylolyticus]MCK6261692.1 hydrolase [Vibrio amylolyticus]